MNKNSKLYIHNLQLPVHLGWRDDERSEKQRILLNITMNFAEAPKACLNEKLDDTICYARLIEHLRQQIAAKQFQLIEHLAYKIYKFIKDYLLKNYSQTEIKISVEITKKPNIQGLESVSFYYEDET